MPIRLGDQDSGGPGPSWNPYVLVILWLLQFGTLAFLELYLGIYVLILGAFGGAGLIFLLPLFLLTLAVLAAIIIEARHLHAETLTPRLYYRFQAAKSAYFLLLLVLFCVPVVRSAGVWGVLWRVGGFVTPFWGALGYAYVVRRDDGGFEGRGIRAWW